MEKTSLRSLPSVDKILTMDLALQMIQEYGRPLTVEAVRSTLEDIRAQFSERKHIPGDQKLLDRVHEKLAHWTSPTLFPVINASGVVIHTNLGRAPLSQVAVAAIQNVAVGYSTLEFDLVSGGRGSRTVHAETLIQRITGAEAALVVNNNASAVLLTLSALAKRRRVVISRTQLVEIGGSFRIPDVMRQSGAILVEVGATNRVHLRDYEQALREQPIVMLLTAHWSNFKIIGFTSEPATAELVDLARRYAVSFVNDLGSGTFIDTAKYGLAHETTVQEMLQAGADLVTFSGDKLLGGPQAGIIAGRADLVAKLKKHPLARAVRPDKLCLAALSATLLHYIKDEAEQRIPIWRMISASPDHLKQRVARWIQVLQDNPGNVEIELIPGESTVGGGSLPGETLPTWLLGVRLPSPSRLVSKLREGIPPVIARTQNDQVLFDPRTILPEQDDDFLQVLQSKLHA